MRCATVDPAAKVCRSGVSSVNVSVFGAGVAEFLEGVVKIAYIFGIVVWVSGGVGGGFDWLSGVCAYGSASGYKGRREDAEARMVCLEGGGLDAKGH